MTNISVWLWITVFVYVIFQIFTLGTRSFDGDEGVILNVVQSSSWNEFWVRIGSDVHSPLYHILAKASVSIFGIHEWSLRLPAAAAGGLLILLGFWLGKKIWSDKWKALVLGICLGFAPYLYYFHQEARFYSLLLLGAVITYGALLEIIKKPNARSYIIFIIGALILVWTQYLGWFVLGAEFIAIIIMRQWKLVSWGLIIFGLLLLSYTPFIKIAFDQFSGRLSEQGGLLIIQNIQGIISAFYRFGADRLVLGVSPGELMSSNWIKVFLFIISLIAPVVVFIFGLGRIKKYQPWITIAWIVSILSVVVALLVSEIGSRSSRYLIYLWPFYGVILINGAWIIYKKVWGKIIIGLLIILWIGALGVHVIDENRAIGARDIARYLSYEMKENDVVLVKGALAGGEKAVFNYYAARQLTVIDYYADYKPGELSKNRKTPEDVIKKLAEKYGAVWYYDFTYGKLDIDTLYHFVGQRNIGIDKEQKEVILYKIAGL